MSKHSDSVIGSSKALYFPNTVTSNLISTKVTASVTEDYCHDTACPKIN